MNVYVTDYGSVKLPKNWQEESGAKFCANGRFKNANAYMLHLFLTEYTRDKFIGEVSATWEALWGDGK